jgi:hypothetical protein
MKIKSRNAHFVALATAAISKAIWFHEDTGPDSQYFHHITRLEFDQALVEKEIRKWGKDMQPFSVTVDIAVYDEQDYSEEEYTYRFWKNQEFMVTLTMLRNPQGIGYTAVATHVREAGAQEPEERTGHGELPPHELSALLTDPKWNID